MALSRDLLHGTTPLRAVCILADGFRLVPRPLRPWGRGFLGDGIYVTRNPETAFWFADAGRVVLRVRLAGGTRILPLDRPYEPKVISSLRREFGKDVLSADFARAMPRNKSLSRRELASLLNWLWEHRWRRGGDFYGAEVAHFHRQLARYGYDGLGCRATDLGIVVFNPSRVVPLAALRYRHPGAEDYRAAGELVPVEPAELARCAAEELARGEREARLATRAAEAEETREHAAALARELPRWRRALARFAARHVPAGGPPPRTKVPARASHRPQRTGGKT